MLEIPDGQRSISGNAERVGPIAGYLFDEGQYVWMGETWRTGMRFDRGPPRENFSAHTCLTSSSPLIVSAELPRFEMIRLSLDGFKEWLRQRNLMVQEVDSGLSVTYSSPSPCTYTLPSGELSISFDVWRPQLPGKYSSLTLEETAYLLYEPHGGLDVDQATKLWGRIEDLLVVLTDVEVMLSWPKLRIGGLSELVTFYQHRIPRPKESVEVNECWTMFPEIKGQFGQIFERWIEQTERLGSAIHLYLGTRRGMIAYSENHFANLVWGVEALHIQLFPHLESQEIEEKIARVVSPLKKCEQKWARNFLKHAHYPSLKDRLKEVLEALPLNLAKLEVDKFAGKCSGLRNEISHTGGPKGGRAYSQFFQELQEVIPPLDALYHAKILLEIGVPVEVIRSSFLNSPVSGQIKRRLAAVGLHPS